MQTFDNTRIVLVISAGNTGQDEPELGLYQTIPQALGTALGSLITVGGVCSNGSLWPSTTPDIRSTALNPNGYGSMTVYALAEDVQVASAISNDEVEYRDGTSYAAPAVVSSFNARSYTIVSDYYIGWTCCLSIIIAFISTAVTAAAVTFIPHGRKELHRTKRLPTSSK